MLFNFTQKSGPASLTVANKPKGMVLKWPKVADKWHAYYNVYRYPTATDATNDTNRELLDDTTLLRFRDDDDLTIGTTFRYRVSSIDSYGNESAKSPVGSAVAKRVQTNDIDPDAAIPSKVYNAGTANLVRDFDLVDPSLWTIVGDSGPIAMQQEYNQPATTDFGPSKYVLFGFDGSDASTTIKTGADIVVEANKTYYVSLFMGPYNSATTLLDLKVQFYKHNGSGGLTAVGSETYVTNDATTGALKQLSGFVTAPSNCQRMQLIAYCNTIPLNGKGIKISSPVVKERINVARLDEDSVNTSKMVDNAVNVWEKTNPGGSVTVSATTTANIITDHTSHHTAEADTVDVEWRFRNNSGGSRTVDVILRAGATDIETIPGVTIADGAVESYSFLYESPSGGSTDFDVRITAGASSFTADRLYISTKAQKR
jgi:hypothetical protein